MLYKGSCHCGRIAFQVEGTLTGAMSCNCSFCQRKGVLIWFVARGQLQLLTPDENASTYTFNKHVIKHRFCPTCGIHRYGDGVDSKGVATAAVNVRCLEGIELEKLPVEACATFAGVGLAASDVHYRAAVKSNASAEAIVQLQRETDAVAEVHNTLRKGISVQLLPERVT